jgi:predicted AAA+ superfamily ATPase
MYPLSLEERGLETKTVSIGKMFKADDPFSLRISGRSNTKFGDYVDEIVASGLPALRRYKEGEARKIAIVSYIDNLLTHDFAQEGVAVRQPAALKRWLSAFSAAVSSTAGYNEILDAATSGEGHKPAAKTAIAYREALSRLWLIDELPTWLDGENYYSRLKRTPKHYLADPAFVASLLKLDADVLKGKDRGKNARTRFDERHSDITGRLFEALIHQSLNVYASVNNAELSYFHTLNGDHEVDFVLAQGRKAIAVEVKLAIDADDRDVRHLLWLRELMKGDLQDAMVITTGPVAYRRPDGIAVVPAALLGA